MNIYIYIYKYIYGHTLKMNINLSLNNESDVVQRISYGSKFQLFGSISEKADSE